MKKITIIIPTMNESEIGHLIRSVKEELNRMSVEYEVIVIDRSSDDTAKKAKREGAKVYTQQSTGLGGALKEGLMSGVGEVLVTMDADLSHNPKFLPSFIKKMNKPYGVIVGSRKIAEGSTIGWGIRRWLISTVANFLGYYIAGVKVSDLTSGYRAYSRDAIKDINLEEIKSSGYSFQLEILAKILEKGYQLGVVPIIFEDRRSGKSKLSKREIIRFIETVFQLLLKRIRNRF